MKLLMSKKLNWPSLLKSGWSLMNVLISKKLRRPSLLRSAEQGLIAGDRRNEIAPEVSTATVLLVSVAA